MGQLTRANLVYRGIRERRLPRELRRKNEYGVIGAVDFAFMSTTLDHEVAMRCAQRQQHLYIQRSTNLIASIRAALCSLRYASSGEGGGIIYEIQQGLIDRGCDVAWCSQYPFEREILFAPLTALESTGSRVQGNVLVLELRVVVNQVPQPVPVHQSARFYLHRNLAASRRRRRSTM